MKETRRFPDASSLAEALADYAAGILSTAVERRGRARLIVSGGATPRLFFRALSERPLRWEQVTIGLADERLFPWDHPRSNTRLLREGLLKAAARRSWRTS